MSVIKYGFVEGWDLRIDPQTAGETLAKIARRDGHVDPHIVVSESRPRTAPLHLYFEWDDWKAAEQHRVDQASKLIRSVRIVSNDAKVPTLRRPYIHVNTTSDGRPRYYPAAKVMSDDYLREIAINEAVSLLLSAKRRLAEYKELAEEQKAIESLQMKLVAKKTGNATPGRGVRLTANA